MGINDVEVISGPIKIGEKIYLYSIIYDITEKNNQLRFLEESEKKFKQLFNNISNVVFIIKHNKIAFANQYVANLLGYSFPEELIGKEYLDIVKEDDKQSVIKRRTEMNIENITEAPTEEKYMKKDGTIIDVEITGIKISYRNSVACLIIGRDIEDKRKAEVLKKQVIEKQKEVEETKRYDNLKTQFFSTISHELKTPLNIILGAIQLLEAIGRRNIESGGDDSSKYIKIMKQNCYRLLRLINNLIDITRLDAGFMKISFNNHNIVEVVGNITLSVADHIKSYGIDLIFDTEIE